MDDGRQEGRPGSRGGVLEFLVWFRTFLVYFVVTWGGTAKGTTKLHERWRKVTKSRRGSRGGDHEGHERGRKVTKSRRGGRGWHMGSFG